LKIIANTNLKKLIRTCPRTCKRYGKGQVKDTNNNENNENNNIYFILFNKYKAEIERENAKEKIHIISKCKKSEEYTQLTNEEQDRLFYELMSIDKRFK
jgi:hypothetical protein